MFLCLILTLGVYMAAAFPSHLPPARHGPAAPAAPAAPEPAALTREQAEINTMQRLVKDAKDALNQAEVNVKELDQQVMNLKKDYPPGHPLLAKALEIHTVAKCELVNAQRDAALITKQIDSKIAAMVRFSNQPAIVFTESQKKLMVSKIRGEISQLASELEELSNRVGRAAEIALQQIVIPHKMTALTPQDWLGFLKKMNASTDESALMIDPVTKTVVFGKDIPGYRKMTMEEIGNAVAENLNKHGYLGEFAKPIAAELDKIANKFSLAASNAPILDRWGLSRASRSATDAYRKIILGIERALIQPVKVTQPNAIFDARGKLQSLYTSTAEIVDHIFIGAEIYAIHHAMVKDLNRTDYLQNGINIVNEPLQMARDFSARQVEEQRRAKEKEAKATSPSTPAKLGPAAPPVGGLPHAELEAAAISPEEQLAHQDKLILDQKIEHFANLTGNPEALLNLSAIMHQGSTAPLQQAVLKHLKDNREYFGKLLEPPVEQFFVRGPSTSTGEKFSFNMIVDENGRLEAIETAFPYTILDGNDPERFQQAGFRAVIDAKIVYDFKNNEIRYEFTPPRKVPLNY